MKIATFFPFVAVLLACSKCGVDGNKDWYSIVNDVNDNRSDTCLAKVAYTCGDIYRTGDTYSDDKGLCSSSFGGFPHHLDNFHQFTNEHLKQSTQFLLLSAHFGTHVMNRAGFQKYYRELSDQMWEDTIKLIKYVNGRGGRHHNLTSPGESSLKIEIPAEENYRLNELSSMAFALDKQKTLGEVSLRIHKSAMSRGNHHDSDLINFIENEYTKSTSEKIRELAGHVTNLADMMRTPDSKLAVFMFDQFLSS